MRIRSANRRRAKAREFEELSRAYVAVYPMGSFAPRGQWRQMITRPMPEEYIGRCDFLIRRRSRRCFAAVRSA